MQQWIDVKQKVIVRQLLFVITSLFLRKWSHALKFTRALIDFIMFAQYRFHDEFILQYLNVVLKRMNFFKKIFRHLRFANVEFENEHFNFFKFHVMIHYSNFIRRYKTTNKFNTSHDEVRHKYMLKNFFDRINKREIFQIQLLRHNRRRINILIMKKILRVEEQQQFNFNDAVNEDDIVKDVVVCSNRVFIDLNLLNYIRLNSRHWKRVFFQILNVRSWCFVKKLVQLLTQIDLISILIVFIKEQRRKENNLKHHNLQRWRLKSNDVWIKQ